MSLMGTGSGLTNSKLRLANAQPDYVSSGKTFYAGDKTLKTGTLVERGQYQNAGGIGAGGSSTYFSFKSIPEGIYRKNGSSLAPEIRLDKKTVLDYVLKSTTINANWKVLQQQSNHRYKVDFSVAAKKVYLVVLQCSDMDGVHAYTELSIPVNHHKYISYEADYTQDTNYLNASTKVCLFQADASGTCSAAVVSNGIRAVGFVGVWRVVQ